MHNNLFKKPSLIRRIILRLDKCGICRHPNWMHKFGNYYMYCYMCECNESADDGR